MSPVVLEKSACMPVAELLLPVVLEKRVFEPDPGIESAGRVVKHGIETDGGVVGSGGGAIMQGVLPAMVSLSGRACRRGYRQEEEENAWQDVALNWSNECGHGA